MCAAVSGENSDRLRMLAARVRWRVLFDLAERHGVQPLIYQAASQSKEVIPAPEMRILAQLYQTNLHRAMLLARALIHLVDHLASKALEVLPHKGLALAEALYGDMALRLSWGDNPSFALSVGGLNPHFQPPPGFPTLKRLTNLLSSIGGICSKGLSRR